MERKLKKLCNCENVLKSESFLSLGVCEDPSIHPDIQRDRQYFDVGKGGDDEDDNGTDKDGRRDEDSRSKGAESSHSDGDKPHPGCQPMEPEPSQSAPPPPRDPTQKSSASARRALFARRRLDASASASSGGSRSPSAPSLIPQRGPSPPRSPSPRPCQSPAPPSSLSPSSCHVSTSALRPVSPVRGLSPIIVQSLGLESSGPPCSLADSSAPCHTRLHPRDRPSTARLVSLFSFCFIRNMLTWHLLQHFHEFSTPSLTQPLFLSRSQSVMTLCFCRAYN